MADRKVSPLITAPTVWGGGGTVTAPPPDPQAPELPAAAAPAPVETAPPARPAQAAPAKTAGRRRQVPVVVPAQADAEGGRRRKRQAHPLKDIDLVSFNCKMTVVCRRRVGTFAAEHDVDKQDVVERALVEFFIRRGVDPEEIPLRPGAPDLS